MQLLITCSQSLSKALACSQRINPQLLRTEVFLLDFQGILITSLSSAHSFDQHSPCMTKLLYLKASSPFHLVPLWRTPGFTPHCKALSRHRMTTRLKVQTHFHGTENLLRKERGWSPAPPFVIYSLQDTKQHCLPETYDERQQKEAVAVQLKPKMPHSVYFPSLFNIPRASRARLQCLSLLRPCLSRAGGAAGERTRA